MVRSAPGFVPTLRSHMESLPRDVLDRVNRRGGLQLQDLLSLILQPVDHGVHLASNPHSDFVVKYFDIPPEVTEIGYKAYLNDSVAFCILCGGAGTRFGGTKGLVKIPGLDRSLLQHKLEQARDVKNVWVMASPSNYDDVLDQVRSSPGGDRVKVFQQFECIRLTPDNVVYFDHEGRPSLYPCGHGDLIPALQSSGVLDDFLSDGGQTIVVTNVDNVAAGPEYSILGQHIVSGRPVTCEVVTRRQSDPGGVLCISNGIPQIVEQFRLTSTTDKEQFTWLNTNTFIIDAHADFSQIQWSWHRVRKNVNDQIVVQYERLIQDLTETFETQYIEVPRETRYVPIKTAEDMAALDGFFRAA